MKKKLKVLVAFSVLMICMSSCVYSLFPIYTEDTLVYIPELIGKWQSGEDEDDYIQFESMTKKEPFSHDGEAIRNGQMITAESEYTDSLAGDGWSIKFNGPLTMEVNGEIITDRDSVWNYYNNAFKEVFNKKLREFSNDERADKSSGKKEKGKSLAELGEKMSDALNKVKYDGTAYVARDNSYKMIVMDDGNRLVYQVHVVSIGEDFFLDLYSLPEFSDVAFGENLFPVHTFMKMDLTDGKLNLTMFDLEKLNKLFESNLVRLRHENVDGTILITAQPEEIQKFLDKYSNDESVFESVESYARVDQ